MNHVIVSRPNKALIVPDIPGTRVLFPSAPRLPHGNNGALVLRHGISELIGLKHLGFPVPNPLDTYYDFCGGKPFNVQRKTCVMLSENPRAYVLNHMGTGKTKTALWAWDFLNKEGLCGKLLVCAPLSTINFVWAREVFATLPHRKCVSLHGTKAKRLERLQDDADIYIINHDGVKVIGQELFARTDIDALVLDELAVYRNNSERSKQMRKFAKAERFKIVWGMTGAPMPNEPTDVWAQCRIVTPHTVPSSRNHARDMLMTRISQYVWKPKPDAVDTAFNMMQPAVRFALDEVVELPDLISRTLDVDLGPKQSKTYDKLMGEYKVMVDNKEITAMNAGAAMNKLLQISGGWVYTQSPAFVKLDAEPRIDALLDLIDSAERKVLVFVPYTHALNGLAEILTKEKIDHCVVDGSTPDRDGIFNKFQNTPHHKVMLAHPKCLAHGVTLTAADTIIWYSPITSLETYEQANARIRRIGQKHKQQLLHLQATAVEKKLYSMLRSKQKIQDQLLSLFEEATNGRLL